MAMNRRVQNKLKKIQRAQRSDGRKIQEMPRRESYRVKYRVLMMGQDGVGKTALCKRYIGGVFKEDLHQPTLDEVYKHQTTVYGERVLLLIQDNGRLMHQYTADEFVGENISGILLCFSVTDRHSFDLLRDDLGLIERARRGMDVPVVVCGTKCDLATERCVTKEEAEIFCNESVAMYPWLDWYVETSAKYNHNADFAFEKLVRLMQLASTEVDQDVILFGDAKPKKWCC